MSSTTVRHTPSLTIPSTQNTAPIFEFRCLYTHDLRRKAKRWQDGLIRFHTFNRRAMVYDESKNFIGDTHCREKEPIQDGDEIKLDKGVLIQVGESVGSVEQDLTELLQRRTSKAPEPFVNEPAATESYHIHPATPGTSSAAAFTQLRPKSLNTLLGMSHGRTGRALLPSKFQYDQRTDHLLLHISSPKSAERSQQPARPWRAPNVVLIELQGNGLAYDRPAKRQKISNLPKRTNGSERSESHCRIPERDYPTSNDLPPKSNEQTLESRETIMIDSDEPQEPTCSPMDDTTTKIVGRSADRTRLRLPDPPLKPTKRLADAQELPSKYPLRLVSRKPRKKLIYRDLLPEVSSGAAKATVPSTHSPSPRSISPKSILPDTRKQKMKKKDRLTDFHEAQQKRIKKRLGRRQSNDESLFLTSDDDLVQSFPAVDNRDLMDEFDTPRSRPSVLKNKPPDRPVKSPEERQKISSPKQSAFVLPQESSAEVPKEVALSPNAASLELARMDELLLSRPEPRKSTVREKGIAPQIAVVISSDSPLGPDQNLADMHVDPELKQRPHESTEIPLAARTLPAFQPQQPRTCALDNQIITTRSPTPDAPSSSPAFQQHEYHSFTNTPPITIAVPTLPAFQPQHPKPATTNTELAAPLLINTNPPRSPQVFSNLPPSLAASTDSITNLKPSTNTTLAHLDDLALIPPLPDPISPKFPLLNPLESPLKPPKRPLRKSTTQLFKPPATVAKRTLKKTISDTTGMQSVVSVSAAKRDDDLGPWSREAFDLFGFGRPGDGLTN